MPAIDAVLTIWPPSPWPRICGRKARMPCSTPIRLTSSTQRQLSREMLSMPPPAATPALLQTTCTLPKASKDSLAACSTLAASATSQTVPRTSVANSCRPLTAACSAVVSMSASITFMPACANARPSASPMPLAPPVTKAVLPANSRMILPQYPADARHPTLHDGARTGSEFAMTSPLTVVFDLDGTLVDTAPDLIGALNFVLDREGLPPVPLHTARNMIGAGARKLIERGLEVEGRAASLRDITRLTADFIDYYAAHIADTSRPFEGLEAALDDLSARGYRFAVCTNKLEWLSKLLLDRLELSGRFSAICGADTFGVSKPDPAILQQTIARAGG